MSKNYSSKSRSSSVPQAASPSPSPSPSSLPRSTMLIETFDTSGDLWLPILCALVLVLALPLAILLTVGPSELNPMTGVDRAEVAAGWNLGAAEMPILCKNDRGDEIKDRERENEMRGRQGEKEQERRNERRERKGEIR